MFTELFFKRLGSGVGKNKNKKQKTPWKRREGWVLDNHTVYRKNYRSYKSNQVEEFIMRNQYWIVFFSFLFLVIIACSNAEEAPVEKTKSPAVTGQVQEMAKEAAPAEAPGEVSEPAQTGPMSGEQVYNKTCMICHGDGIAGAPKMGDKEAWQARIAQGMEILESRAIQGYQGSQGSMPAKGGNVSLSDEEVKSAVAYMVEKSS
jgi:cytochrome c5